MKIDCISDLHGFEPILEGGDMLIIAGDLTLSDFPLQYEHFFEWLKNQDYTHKIVIGGNHDNELQRKIMYGNTSLRLGRREDGAYDFHYLCDSSVEIEGLKLYGTPWTSRFDGINPYCCAFTLFDETLLAHKWESIPDDIDILVTHCPPYGIMDQIRSHDKWENVGSKSLLYKVMNSSKIKLHVFGHIHEGYGELHNVRKSTDEGQITFVNASHIDQWYEHVNKPIRIEL